MELVKDCFLSGGFLEAGRESRCEHVHGTYDEQDAGKRQVVPGSVVRRIRMEVMYGRLHVDARNAGTDARV